MLQSYADLGTNTFHHILIDRREDGSYSVIDYRVRFVKLMSGGTQQMAPDAKERAISVLKEYATLIQEHQIEQVGWYATEGLRSLDSSNHFRTEIKESLGIQIQLISGSEEAEYIADSLAQCAPDYSSFLGFDIGGGSTELIAQGQSRTCASYKMGAAILFKTFHHTEPITLQEISAIRSYCNQNIQEFLEAQAQFQPQILVGASGSLDSVLELLFYPKSETEIFQDQPYIELQYEQFKKVYEQVIPCSLEERLQLNGMNSKRAEMMTSALIMADCIWTKFKHLNLRVSRFSLLMALVNTNAKVYSVQ